MQNLNVAKDAIGRQEDVDEVAYLQGVKLPRAIDYGDISLLIGVDVPEALQPVEIRKSRSGGPYAVKALFGWTLNGPLNRYSNDQQCFFMSATSSSDELLSNQLKLYFNHEFNESIAVAGKTMSVEDKRSLQIFENSAQLVKGHYQIAIPWRQDQPCMPNNRQIAEQRLSYLKKRLDRDPILKKKYTNFIDDLLVKGHVRTVPDQQFSCNDEYVWYLPHRDVVYAKKPDKVRVVFDCAVKYHGESLNDKVLQGPDLMNSLIAVLCRYRQEDIAIMDIKVDKSIFWTDSTSVLRYIHNENKRFHTFVANRISIIHDGSEHCQWRYINTMLNPADDASRGLSVESYLTTNAGLKDLNSCGKLNQRGLTVSKSLDRYLKVKMK